MTIQSIEPEGSAPTSTFPEPPPFVRTPRDRKKSLWNWGIVGGAVRDSFMKKLSAADLDSLIAELEPIAFGNDTAALEALRQKVIREVDEELGVMASNTTGLPLRGVPHSLCHPLGPVPKLE